MTTVDISWKRRAQKAETKLQTIKQLKTELDSCHCDNPSSHASCLDNFANEVQSVLDMQLRSRDD